MITNHQEIQGVLSIPKAKRASGIVWEKHTNFQAFKTLFMLKQDNAIDPSLNSDCHTYNNRCKIFFIFNYILQ